MAPPSPFQRALALMNSGQLEAAIALAGGPEARRDPATLNVAAACAARLGLAAVADDFYRRALKADPRFAAAHSNYGIFLQDHGRWDEAERALGEAVRLQPAFVEAHYNLAILRGRLNRWAEAEAGHHEALRLRPDHPGARFNLGALLLARGAFEEGWPLFEARRDPRAPEALPPPALPFPEWTGQPLDGKSLLVWFEQGFGDEIQTARYVPWLKARGAARVSLVCKPPLAPLFATLAGVDAVIPASGHAQIDLHDFWIPPFSIPYRAGARLETIPAEIPYLASTWDRRARWDRALPAGDLRIGLAWRGSAALKNDANRSLVGLSALAPLWSVPGAVFVSLQKGPGEEEADIAPPGQPIIPLGPQIGDFADTAAIIDQLDLVICVDTAVAHLAGALGKPCWVLLPRIGTDWRWLRDREDSPWYPTLRLFRQGAGETWDTVIARIAQALATYAAESG